MTPRDQAYLDILGFGLLRIREAAGQGLIAYCAIESEHLHNIPSLVGESNELRHKYYFEQERDYYLQRIDRTIPDIGFTLARYGELWSIIEKRASGELALSDIFGAWSDPDFESGLIERCKVGWDKSLGTLSNQELSTYLRQKIAVEYLIEIARGRVKSNFEDGTEFYDGELAEAINYAVENT